MSVLDITEEEVLYHMSCELGACAAMWHLVVSQVLACHLGRSVTEQSSRDQVNVCS